MNTVMTLAVSAALALYLSALYACDTSAEGDTKTVYVLCSPQPSCSANLPHRDNENVATDSRGRTLGVYRCTREGPNAIDKTTGQPGIYAAYGVCLAAWKDHEPVEMFAIEDPAEASALGTALLEVAQKADPMSQP